MSGFHPNELSDKFPADRFEKFRTSDLSLHDKIKPLLSFTDEATCATGSYMWLVFGFLPPGPKITMGDSRKLPPVVHYENTLRALRRLSFQTLLQLLGVPYTDLTEQHRSVKAISNLVFYLAYEKRLTTDPKVDHRYLILIDPKSAVESAVEASGSTYNIFNVRVVIDAVVKLLAGGIDPAAITILTPYMAHLSAYVTARTFAVEQLDRRIAEVSVETVEWVPSREFYHVIVDFTRTKSSGFLIERSRMNVEFGKLIKAHKFDRTPLGDGFSFFAKQKQSVIPLEKNDVQKLTAANSLGREDGIGHDTIFRERSA
ncbi:hypothetical protein IWZ03DRAFT_432982 [Phyllosticta citriasiana]|uniref:DNA2/NAM7 helicase-like C-terminal domain-containing protein n=1 Tax=Phyllosticta citriasiana TaxID=595635 RepID=A0ABR1KAF2_9PEZI